MNDASAQAIAVYVLSGPQTSERHVFRKKTISLGRDPANDVVLAHDKAVSSCHARLSCEKGTWIIEDLSKNGIFCEEGGVRRRLARQTAVASGQLFLLGKTLLRFETPEVPQAPDATPAHDAPREEKLILRITLSEERIIWQLLNSDACGTSYTCPYHEEDAADLNRRLRSIIASQNEVSQTANPQTQQKAEDALRQVGAYLRDHYLPVRIRERLLKAGNQNLFLLHEAQFTSIPWELALAGDDCLSLLFDMGRQVVVEDYSAEFRRPPAQGQTRMLIVCNPTDDLSAAQTETEALFAMVRETHPEILLDFLAGPRVKRLELLSRLSQTDIVYFVGHAEYDPHNPANSGWPLGTGRVTAVDFRSLRQTPALVFANGCETGREDSWSDPASALRGNHGIASAFILAGVQHYLGAVWPIPANNAATFAREFFARLLQGSPIGKSLRCARLRAIETFGRGNLVWASYVLYGDPAGTPVARW